MIAPEPVEDCDVLSAEVVRRLRATIGGEAGGGEGSGGNAAPLLAHWLCFLPSAPMAALGEDGHPARADASALADLPRRMWAGSMIAFHRPLRIGVPLTRRMAISPPSEKVGRGGQMAFVRVDHAISDPDGPLTDRFDEEHRRLFTFNMAAEHELVNLRAVATGRALELPALMLPKGDGDPAQAKLRDHILWMDGAEQAGAIYDRAGLEAGDVIRGPAIVVEMDSTTLIETRHIGTVDAHGNILITPEG